MDSICRFCGALHFAAERSSDGLFTQCCQKGKVILPEDEFGNVLHYPPFLQSLLSNPADPNYRNFRENIRSYNNSVSFASIGAKIVKLHGLHVLLQSEQKPQRNEAHTAQMSIVCHQLLIGLIDFSETTIDFAKFIT